MCYARHDPIEQVLQKHERHTTNRPDGQANRLCRNGALLMDMIHECIFMHGISVTCNVGLEMCGRAMHLPAITPENL